MTGTSNKTASQQEPTSSQDAARTPRELEAALGSFSALSQELLAGYDALQDRADRMERELEQKVGELEAVLESLPCGVLVCGGDDQVLHVNTRATDILGRSSQQLTNTDVPVGLDKEGTVDWTRDDSGVRSLVVRSSSVENEHGKSLGSVIIVDDRTELAELTERLHRLDKMAALGTLGAGIAHEIRNPLNAISGFASLMVKRVEGDDTLRKWAQHIADGAREADAIISGLLTFAAPERIALQQLDASELAREVIALALRESEACEGPTATVGLECGESISLAGDRLKLRQALRNLIANALDAQRGEEAAHAVLSITEQGSAIAFDVRDAGPGMPDDVARRATEPFYTTRAEGTGLGLALAHTIAQLHGGDLTIRPEPAPEGGAWIRLRVPRAGPGS